MPSALPGTGPTAPAAPAATGPADRAASGPASTVPPTSASSASAASPASAASAASPAPSSAPAERRDATRWVGLHHGPLPVAEAVTWCTRPDCGAVVTFTGTVRDHAEDRHGVVALTYEAYEQPALDRLGAVATDTARRWPSVRRLAIHHRLGTLAVGEPAVVVVVATGHRADAFAAASHAIDATKATVPIWKHEVWATGQGWGTGAAPVADVPAAPVADVPAAPVTDVPAAPVAPGEHDSSTDPTGRASSERAGGS